MRVALFGGTGFLGSYLVDALLDQGHEPVLLVRPGSEARVRQRERCALVTGQIHDTGAIRHTLEGCQAAIYAIGILREDRPHGVTFEALHFQGLRRVAEGAVALGVGRLLYTSAHGVGPSGTGYQRSKYKAEEYLRGGESNWTILRPTVMFGDPRGRQEFCSLLVERIIKSPLPAPLFHTAPLPFNAGGFTLSPIHVRDVATLYIRALEAPWATHQTYELCGPRPLTWRELLRLLARVRGTYKLMVPVWAPGARLGAALGEALGVSPVSPDQLAMLLEGGDCESHEVFERFELVPTRCDDSSLAYLRAL